jgi:hypothetical protein
MNIMNSPFTFTNECYVRTKLAEFRDEAEKRLAKVNYLGTKVDIGVVSLSDINAIHREMTE